MPPWKHPTVTVIIPAYNAARWISEAIAGVTKQTFQDSEIIVVDDGSTDDTRMKVLCWGNRIRYLPQMNGGMASARNVGIKAAQGHYIAFLDADDTWLPDKLQRQLQLFQQNPDLTWCYGDTLFVDGETGRQLYTQSQIQKQQRGDVLRALLLSNFIPISTVMVKKSAFDQIGLFDESLRTCADRDMWLRLAAAYPVGYVRETLAVYRQHADQNTQRMPLDNILNTRLAVIQAAVRRNPERLADLLPLAMSNLHTNIGWVWFNRDNLSEARRLFRQAITLRPSSIRAWVYWLASFVPGPLLDRMIAVVRALRKRV